MKWLALLSLALLIVVALLAGSVGTSQDSVVARREAEQGRGIEGDLPAPVTVDSAGRAEGVADVDSEQDAQPPVATSSSAVVVVDRRGAPIPNCPVQFGTIRRDGDFSDFGVNGTSTTDASGGVLLVEAANELLVQPLAGTLGVRSDIPFTESASIEWPLRRKTEPAELVAPDAVPLTIRFVTAEGDRWPGKGRVVLSRVPQERDTVRRLFEGGRLDLGPVGVDVAMALRVDSLRGYESVDVDVPALSIDEERREVTVTIDRPSLILRMRFVDAAGAPIRDRSALLDGLGVNAAPESDADGVVEVPLPGVRDATTPTEIAIQGATEAGSWGLTGRVVVPGGHGPGEYDAGDVVLTPVPLFFEARVALDDGTVLPFASFDVYRLDLPGGPERVCSAMSSKVGALEQKFPETDPGPGPFCIVFEDRSSFRFVEPPTFERGQRGLRFVPAPAAMANGRLQWTGPGDAPRIDVLAHRPPGPALTARVSNGRRFTLRVSSDGPVELEARLARSQETLHSWTATPITDPSTATPQPDVPVGSGVHETTLRIPRAEFARYLWFRPAGQGEYVEVQRVRGATDVRVLTVADRIDIEVRVPGAKPLALRGLTAGKVHVLGPR